MKINIGIVGAGFVSNIHLEGWRKIKNAQVVALCDINQVQAKELAQRWSIPKIYSSLDELIKDKSNKEVQIIDICTPPFTHTALVKTALENGYHVICEKPLCFTTMEADQIGESVARSENILEVVRSVMYQPVVLRAKELISSGRLGDVIHMNVEWLHTPKEPMAINSKHWTHNIPGGKLAETIPHLIVLAHNFLGNSEVIKVLPTKIGSYSWMRSDELNLLFKNGEKTASAYLSFNAPVELLTITLFCQKEVIKIDLNSQTLNKIGLHPKSDNRFSRFYSLIGNNFEAMGEILKISLKKALNQEDTPFYNQARRFLEAIELNNKTEYSWDKCYNEIKLQEIIALLI